jgi:hypothetical protein
VTASLGLVVAQLDMQVQLASVRFARMIATAMVFVKHKNNLLTIILTTLMITK